MNTFWKKLARPIQVTDLFEYGLPPSLRVDWPHEQVAPAFMAPDYKLPVETASVFIWVSTGSFLVKVQVNNSEPVQGGPMRLTKTVSAEGFAAFFNLWLERSYVVTGTSEPCPWELWLHTLGN